MPKYNKIKVELTKALEELNPIIEMLDQLRITNTAATVEQTNLINSLSLTHSPEVITLMLESKSRKRNKKLEEQENIKERYEPFLLCNYQDINNFRKYLAGLPERHICNYDIILRPNDAHSSALQIHTDELSSRVFFVEVAVDINKDERNLLAEATGANLHIYKQGKIQNSDYGCTIFSLQNLNIMNRLIKEGTYLKEGDNILSELDPAFLKHIQSLNHAESYKESNLSKKLFIDKHKNKTLEKHIDDFTITVQVADTQGNLQAKKRNSSSLYKTKKYLESALKVLESLPKENQEQELENIISVRNGRNIINSVYQNMGLTTEQTTQVKGLYNQDQIKLALKYQIPANELNKSKFFLTKEMSKYILALIETTAGEDKELAHNIFKQVQNLSNPFQTYLVLSCGLDHLEVAKSKALNNPKLAPDISMFIQKWHDKAGIAGAKAAFSLIQSFEKNKNEMSNQTIIGLKESDESFLLDFSISTQNRENVKLWLEAGVNVNSNNKTSTLSMALKTNNSDIITDIILCGAKLKPDIVKDNPAHFTPEKLKEYFKLAIDGRKIEAISNIVALNPQIIQEPIDGLSPMEYLIREKKSDLLEKIFNKYSDILKVSNENLSLSNIALNSPTKKRSAPPTPEKNKKLLTHIPNRG